MQTNRFVFLHRSYHLFGQRHRFLRGRVQVSSAFRPHAGLRFDDLLLTCVSSFLVNIARPAAPRPPRRSLEPFLKVTERWVGGLFCLLPSLRVNTNTSLSTCCHHFLSQAPPLCDDLTFSLRRRQMRKHREGWECGAPHEQIWGGVREWDGGEIIVWLKVIIQSSCRAASP